MHSPLVININESFHGKKIFKNSAESDSVCSMKKLIHNHQSPIHWIRRVRLCVLNEEAYSYSPVFYSLDTSSQTFLYVKYFINRILYTLDRSFILN